MAGFVWLFYGFQGYSMVFPGFSRIVYGCLEVLQGGSVVSRVFGRLRSLDIRLQAEQVASNLHLLKGRRLKHLCHGYSCALKPLAFLLFWV